MSMVTGFQNTAFMFGNIQIEESTGKIFSTDPSGVSSLLGYTKKAYDELEKLASDAITKSEELQKKAEDYESRLIEAGLLQKPMTQEEQFNALVSMVQSLTQNMSDLSMSVSSLQERVNELSGTSPNRKGSLPK